MDLAYCSSQGSGSFFFLKQTNLPVSYWSNLILATQPTHYIFPISRKTFLEQAVRDRLALQGGTGDFPWDAVAGKGLILPRGGNHVVFLELRRDSRVTTGISGFLLGWPWESQSSPRVARESWGLCSGHCRAEETSPRRVSGPTWTAYWKAETLLFQQRSI